MKILALSLITSLCTVFLMTGCKNKLDLIKKDAKVINDQKNEIETLKKEFEIANNKSETEINLLKVKIKDNNEIENSIRDDLVEHKKELSKLKSQNQTLISKLKENEELDKQKNIAQKNDIKDRNINNNAKKVNNNERYLLELTFPVPGTRGKELGLLLIDTKSEIDRLSVAINQAGGQFNNMVTQFNNINDYRPSFGTIYDFMVQRNEIGAQNVAVQNGHIRIQILKDSLLLAKNRYNLLKNLELTLDGDGINKAKKAIIELELKLYAFTGFSAKRV